LLAYHHQHNQDQNQTNKISQLKIEPEEHSKVTVNKTFSFTYDNAQFAHTPHFIALGFIGDNKFNN